MTHGPYNQWHISVEVHLIVLLLSALGVADVHPTVLVIGALGQCGKGALDVAQKIGIPE